MLNRHDFLCAAFSSYDELLTRLFYNQRMIAGCQKCGGKTIEQRAGCCLRDCIALTVPNHPCIGDSGRKHLSYGLMPQTDSQHGNIPVTLLNDRFHISGSMGMTCPR